MSDIIRIPSGGGGGLNEPFVFKVQNYNSGAWGTSSWTADKDYSYIIAEGLQNNGGQTFKVNMVYSGNQENVLFKSAVVGASASGDNWRAIILVKDVKAGDKFTTGQAVNHNINIYCLQSEK